MADCTWGTESDWLEGARGVGALYNHAGVAGALFSYTVIIMRDFRFCLKSGTIQDPSYRSPSFRNEVNRVSARVTENQNKRPNITKFKTKEDYALQ